MLFCLVLGFGFFLSDINVDSLQYILLELLLTTHNLLTNLADLRLILHFLLHNILLQILNFLSFLSDNIINSFIDRLQITRLRVQHSPIVSLRLERIILFILLLIV